MTDKEMFLHLISKLDLKEAEGTCVDKDEYAINNNIITIGAGKGYGGFYTDFEFDDQGNLISHAVAE